MSHRVMHASLDRGPRPPAEDGGAPLTPQPDGTDGTPLRSQRCLSRPEGTVSGPPRRYDRGGATHRTTFQIPLGFENPRATECPHSQTCAALCDHASTERHDWHRRRTAVRHPPYLPDPPPARRWCWSCRGLTDPGANLTESVGDPIPINLHSPAATGNPDDLSETPAATVPRDPLCTLGSHAECV